jgi:Flp pilus assembly protein TadG
MMLRRRRARTGSVVVESALAYPVLFMVVLGIILLGMAVFRYQQVSHISREASRWASVHGAQYSRELNGNTATTSQNVYDNAIQPQAAGMQPESITYTVTWGHADPATGTWVTDRNPTWVYQPSGNDPTSGLPYSPVKRNNTVTVTVTYTWNTGLFGTIPVTSTSVNTIQY